MRIFIRIWRKGVFGALLLYITLNIPTKYLLIGTLHKYDMR